MSYIKCFLTLLASVFEDLFAGKEIFKVGADFAQYPDFSIKSQPLKKIHHFEKFKSSLSGSKV